MPLDGYSLAAGEERLEQCASAPIVVAENGAPRWVNILPLSETGDGRIYARDGREFILDDVAELVRRSNAAIKKTGPQPVDKDHEMQSWLRPGGPALGWANAYELRADGVWADVEWLPAGAGFIARREYRYTSSVVRCEVCNVKRDEDGWIEDYDLRMKELSGFTITNIPALEVSAMFTSGAPRAQRTRMDITALLALVGLPPTASKEEFFAAAQKKLSENPSPDKFVPRAEFDTLRGQLLAAQAELKKHTEEVEEKERRQLLDKALEEKKLFPFEAEYHLRRMREPNGIAEFKEYVASRPSIGSGPSPKPPPPPGGTKTHGLTERQLKLCEELGITPEAYIVNKKQQET